MRLWQYSPINKHLVKSLEKCQPAVAEKRALNAEMEALQGKIACF